MNEVIIVIKEGNVQDVFCRDSTTVVKIIDLADKLHDKIFCWPDTQWDDQTVVLLTQGRTDNERK